MLPGSVSPDTNVTTRRARRATESDVAHQYNEPGRR
jgi:hypothetical protein